MPAPHEQAASGGGGGSGDASAPPPFLPGADDVAAEPEDDNPFPTDYSDPLNMPYNDSELGSSDDEEHSDVNLIFKCSTAFRFSKKIISFFF